MTRWIAGVGLVVAGVLAVAAVATAPDGTPEEGAVPEPETPATAAAPGTPDASPSAAPTPLAVRPAEPTGKPGGRDAPAFDGDLTAAQVPVLRPAPPLEDLDGWLQTGALGDLDGLDDLRGRVVLLQFWTFSCSNCKATIPNLQALRDAHAEREDFAIVGVHYPEFAFEEDPDAIAAAADDLGVTWPIALDTDGTNFHRWQEGSSGYWPRTYVLDREGDIRFDHVGEGRYDELNATVTALLEDGAA